MENLIWYLLKVNIALALFYMIYRLFFEKDTFFQLRRFTLLVIYLVAFTYPLLDISSWLSVRSGINEVVTYYSAYFSENAVEVAAEKDLALSNWQPILLMITRGVYLLGCCTLFFRCLIAFISLIKVYLNSPKVTLNGVDVYSLSQKKEAYSFFSWLFIHPEISEEPTVLEEILRHELTHIRQRHSWDVLISEMVCICCWINPFVWLLKKEVVINHEYLADQEVISAGYNKKMYQYHLIGVECPPPVTMAAANLYNNFNVLPLKKRISMLNKKRTNNSRKVKYLVLLPLVLGLLIANNLKAVKHITVETPVILTEITSSITQYTDTVYTYKESEVKPEFPGGDVELMKYVGRNLKYPVNAQKNGIQGRAVASFIVEKDGTISNPTIERVLDPELDEEALRIIGTFPKWTPGVINGKPVRVKYTIPVLFRLQ